jgi:O-antigen/teichoic acid export membrane protein
LAGLLNKSSEPESSGKKSILSDFLSLSFSSFGSQLISVLCVYILATKLGADSFGSYSLFLAYASIVVIFSSLSFEQAFPSLTGRDFDALVYATTALAAVVSWITYVCAELLGYSLAMLLGVFVFSNSLGRLGELIAVRAKFYKLVSLVRVLPNLLLLAALIYFVFVESFSLESIVVAHLVSFSAAWVSLYVAVFISQVDSFPSLPRMVDVMIAERKFAFFVAPSQLFNRVAFSLPLILIDRFFGGFFAGQYALIQRIGFAPVSLIGAATSQIFLGHLGDLKREEVVGEFDLPFLLIKRNLILSAMLVTFGFLVVVPVLLPMLMPEEWSVAITTGMILAPCLGMTLVAYPLTAVFTVYKMHQYLFFNQMAYCLITILSFLGGYWGMDYLYCIAIFSALASLRYLVLYVKADSIIAQKIALT